MCQRDTQRIFPSFFPHFRDIPRHIPRSISEYFKPNNFSFGVWDSVYVNLPATLLEMLDGEFSFAELFGNVKFIQIEGKLQKIILIKLCINRDQSHTAKLF